MVCPVCTGSDIPEAIISKKGRITLKGTIGGQGRTSISKLFHNCT